jgi:hypothetical protein
MEESRRDGVICRTSLGQTYLSQSYPQDNVFTVDKFLEFLKKRDVKVSREILESWYREKLLSPFFFMKRERLEEAATSMEYKTIVFSPAYYKECLREGNISFPSEGSCLPWKDYLDEQGREETWIFYHPIQILQVVPIYTTMTWLTSYEALPKDSAGYQQYVEEAMKERRRLEEILHRTGDNVDRLCQLILVLGDVYLPRIRKRLSCFDLFNETFLEDWYGWVKDLDIPNEVKRLGFDNDMIHRWYKHLSLDGKTFDPLSDWYLLVRHISPAKRQKLRGKAILAQDYYDFAYVLKHLLEDLGMGELCEPDEVTDANKGFWKLQRYGGRVDYKSRSILENILREYGISTKLLVFLLCEGETEMQAIPIIAEAMGINFEEKGIHFECLGGSAFNKTVWRLRLGQIQDENGVPFAILDKENKADECMEGFSKAGLIDQENYVLWEDEFESANWTDEEILEQFNDLARESHVNLVLSPDHIQSYRDQQIKDRKSTKITKLLERMAYEADPNYTFSKVELGKRLAEKTAGRIRSEIERDEYAPNTKIEEALIRVERLCLRRTS